MSSTRTTGSWPFSIAGRSEHIQIVPRDHFRCFDEAPAEIVCAIVLLGQRIALALKKLYGVPRVAFLFTGGDIPHLHAHVVPMHERPTSPHVVTSWKTA